MVIPTKGVSAQGWGCMCVHGSVCLGCLPWGCLPGGVCPGGVQPPGPRGRHTPPDPEVDTPCPIACWDTPPVDRQTPVPKLRLREVIKVIKINDNACLIWAS